jgi:class 3 adenylate cyclase
VLPVVQAPALVLHRKGDQVEAIEAGRYVASRIGSARFVELDGDDGIPWLGDVEALASEVENFLAGRAGADKGSDRRLATVLFTDIVGSTKHLAALGDARWHQRLREHDRIVERAIVRHDGRKIDSTGDGVFATFDGPAAAVRCAQGIIEAVRPLEFEIRAGIHTGEVETDGARVRGVAVHLGARIAAEARASQVLVSSTVRDLTAGSGLAFKDVGEHRLKGFERPWQLYVASTSAK